MNTPHDAIIVGGGPAGLAAAICLARYDRSVLLFDAGGGRSGWHQVNANYLGFPDGIAARDLRALGRRQIAPYDQVTICDEPAERLDRRDDGFQVIAPSGVYQGRAVLLATGVRDHFPAFPGWRDYVGRSLFWCIGCDGYACRGQRVVMIGESVASAIEAIQLTRFTPYVTILTGDRDRCAPVADRIDRAGIEVVRDTIATVEGTDGQVRAVHTHGGRTLPADVLFCQTNATPCTELATQVGAPLAESGYLIVTTEQRTSVPGIYAAGDLTRLHSHQVATAVHEGTQAAAALNYDLYPDDLRLPAATLT